MGYNAAKNIMEEKKKGCLKWFFVIIAGILVLGGIATLFDKGDNDTKNTPDETTSQFVAKNESNRAKDSVLWKINTEIDEMTDSKNIWASIKSDNYVNQEFPYQGDTYSTITVRYMKKYGYDVLISIDQGQIVGNDIQYSNYITARFDNSEAKKYYFNGAADYSTETVFLKNAKDFMENCKKAKDIKIEIPLYQGGRPIFSFHVDKPLEWPN